MKILSDVPTDQSALSNYQTPFPTGLMYKFYGFVQKGQKSECR